jgi:hypothetical protein
MYYGVGGSEEVARVSVSIAIECLLLWLAIVIVEENSRGN